MNIFRKARFQQISKQIKSNIFHFYTALDQLIIYLNFVMLEKNPSSDHQSPYATPKSTRTSKKEQHLQKLSSLIGNLPVQDCKSFVLGISGGDCAGKREMTQFLFDKKGDSWSLSDSDQSVTLLRQRYFIKANDGTKYSAEGTNWDLFYRQALNLLIGNPVTINFKISDGKEQTVKLEPAKLLVIEGTHIFMSPQVTKNLSSLINLKVFIDSDSDIRLSRRVYQDVQENKMDLSLSVANYLEYIKPSYQRQIQPTKQNSDIIIPHFGGGFNDHKKQNKQLYDSNIKVACSLILAHLKEQMKKYEQEISRELLAETINN